MLSNDRPNPINMQPSVPIPREAARGEKIEQAHPVNYQPNILVPLDSSNLSSAPETERGSSRKLLIVGTGTGLEMVADRVEKDSEPWTHDHPKPQNLQPPIPIPLASSSRVRRMVDHFSEFDPIALADFHPNAAIPMDVDGGEERTFL
jgi:hypothetical protein